MSTTNFRIWTNCNSAATEKAIADYRAAVGADLSDRVIETFGMHASKLGVVSFVNVLPTIPGHQVRTLIPMPVGGYVINDEEYLDDVEPLVTRAAAEGWFSNDPEFVDILEAIANGDLRATATVGSNMIVDDTPVVMPRPFYLIVWDPKEIYASITEAKLPEHRMLTIMHNPHTSHFLSFADMMAKESWHPSVFLSAVDQQRCCDTDSAWMIIYASESDYVDGEMVQCTVLIASTLTRLNELITIHETNLKGASNESKL